MDPENDGAPVTRPAMAENHNHNRVRKRNLASKEATEDATTESSLCDRVPLVILSDSARAWYDGAVPRIPDAVAANKQNGMTPSRGDENDSNEDDDDDDNNDDDNKDKDKDDGGGGGNDGFIGREKLKISVIRGSVANPDLTLGELRLLGCSSEGFVNGTFSTVNNGMVMINKEPHVSRFRSMRLKTRERVRMLQ